MERTAALLLAAAAVTGCAAPDFVPDDGGVDGRLVLRGGGMVAEIAPGLGGRLMRFGPADGTNALWTAAPGAPPLAGWPNWGGEKTWVGADSTWRGFDPRGRRWPPPAWFDQEAFEVAELRPGVSVALRRSARSSGDWTVALERAFRFEGDRLVVRETLVPDGPAAAPSTNDAHRVWSVTQVPFAPRLAARLRGEGRLVPAQGFPEAADRRGDWVLFDLAAAPDRATLAADADALAVEGPAGWLVVSQRADARFLGAFAEPGRALVYTTGAMPDDPAAAYTELEFVALGRDAAHEISLRLLPPGRTPW